MFYEQINDKSIDYGTFESSQRTEIDIVRQFFHALTTAHKSTTHG